MYFYNGGSNLRVNIVFDLQLASVIGSKLISLALIVMRLIIMLFASFE